MFSKGVEPALLEESCSEVKLESVELSAVVLEVLTAPQNSCWLTG